MIKEPAVAFTPWYTWVERNTVKGAHLPGVYLLAHFDVPPPRRADGQAEEIVYIGETSEGSLMGRWQQFHRAAFEGKAGHSGGLLYRELYGDDYLDSLYVAAFVPQGLSRELRTQFVLYVERKLLWEYTRRWEAPPRCNRR